MFTRLTKWRYYCFWRKICGAAYDKNAKLIIKQAKRSLKEAIKKHEKGENIKIEETAVVPPSYYNWWVIISISGIVVVLLGLGFLV